MASKKTSKSAPKFKFEGYINISIPSSHDNKLKAYIKDSDAVFNDFTQALTDGYAVKNSFDGQQGNHRCTLTGYENTGDNYGYVIGAFAGDWYTALAVLMYKHFHIAKEAWQKDVDTDLPSYG